MEEVGVELGTEAGELEGALAVEELGVELGELLGELEDVGVVEGVLTVKEDAVSFCEPTAQFKWLATCNGSSACSSWLL